MAISRVNWRNSNTQWGWVAMGFHWITVITVIGLFSLGLWMVELTYYDPWYRQAPFIHKSIGVLLFIFTLLRLLWRYIDVKPDELHAHKQWEIRSARLSHILLYILLISVMLSGYFISTADGRAVELFNLFSIPATVYGIEEQEDIAGEIHLVLAIVLVSLSLIHALAAIKHHFFDNDRTLKRMTGH